MFDMPTTALHNLGQRVFLPTTFRDDARGDVCDSSFSERRRLL